ncbi:hypothetical protein [Saccharothrix hoggarensis]|uniref:Alpha/beta hydrolase family protein n=1 Tax=Saccharothrix hoggarensis TaxID=913853 RepID=A0ABW3QH26_9PSEU
MSDFDIPQAAPVLVFVHGIGGPRDAALMRGEWLAGLVEGARRAGHGKSAAALSTSTDVRFVDYSDLMITAGAQGTSDVVSEGEARFLLEFVTTLVDELSAEVEDPRAVRVLVEAKSQLAAEGAQGVGEVVRVLSAALTSVLRIPGLRRAGQWVTERRLLGALAQVGRYLGRGEVLDGASLDERVRQRVLAALPENRPVILVAHSLGSVVTFEALHEYARPVRLLVTLGSPLATAAVVLHRVRPVPPTTPPTVERWLNFWDRDDIVVARPRLERLIVANVRGTLPESNRVDSDGLWVHSAIKYLVQPAVAGPVTEAVCE